MLKDNFFTIVDQTIIDNNTVRFTIWLRKNHTIYQAHFPKNPITPGVCIIQIVKELFSHYKNDDFVITKVKNVKFSHPLIPTAHTRIDVSMKIEETEEENIYTVKSTIYTVDIIYTKINMTLKRGEL